MYTMQYMVKYHNYVQYVKSLTKLMDG
jgi:hypothetical protein